MYHKGQERKQKMSDRIPGASVRRSVPVHMKGGLISGTIKIPEKNHLLMCTTFAGGNPLK
jgi:hypothetical protein